MPETAKTELPPVTDERSAAAHIGGLLDLSGMMDSRDDAPAVEEHESAEDDVELEAEQESDADVAQDEDPASDETTDEDQDEHEAEPHTIEPPKSWSAEDKARFKELPPELQQVVAKREGERDKAISVRMQQIAEERKAIEAHVQTANQAQTQYAQTLNQLLTLTIPELQQVEGVNWVQLASSDPAEYVRLSAVRDGLRQRVGFMQQEMQQVQQHQHAQLQQQHQARLADQYNQLVEQVPEFREPVKAKALVDDISKTLSSYGFTQDELSAVADARIVRAMARLAQLEKLESARKSAQGKKGASPAPRIMTPNAAPAREDNRNKKIQDQYRALQKSGSERDAARLLVNII